MRKIVKAELVYPQGAPKSWFSKNSPEDVYLVIGKFLVAPLLTLVLSVEDNDDCRKYEHIKFEMNENGVMFVSESFSHGPAQDEEKKKNFLKVKYAEIRSDRWLSPFMTSSDESLVSPVFREFFHKNGKMFAWEGRSLTIGVERERRISMCLLKEFVSLTESFFLLGRHRRYLAKFSKV